FGEEIVREVRRGGPTNLIATLDVPDLPERQVTIIATHIENRTTPKGRVKQADELLDMIRPIRNPLVIAGDMNTTGTDGSVLSIKSAVVKKLNSPTFWATQGIKYATGVHREFLYWHPIPKRDSSMTWKNIASMTEPGSIFAVMRNSP